MPTQLRDRPAGALDLLHLGPPADVALLVAHHRPQERGHDLRGDLGSDDPATEAEDVDPVVLHGLMGGVGVVHGAGADAGDLARGHRDARAGTADDDPALRLPGDDRMSDLERLVGVIDRLRAVGSEVQHLMAEPGDQVINARAWDTRRGQSRRRRSWRKHNQCTSWVAPWDGLSSSWAASSAAPRRRSAHRARRAGSARARAGPGWTYPSATSRAGSRSSSPAAAAPPPITTSSGSKVLIALAMPMPRRAPTARRSPSPLRHRHGPPPRRRRRAGAGPEPAGLQRGVGRAPRLQRRAGRARGRPPCRSSDPGWGKRVASGTEAARSAPMSVWPSSPAPPVAPR